VRREMKSQTKGSERVNGFEKKTGSTSATADFSSSKFHELNSEWRDFEDTWIRTPTRFSGTDNTDPALRTGSSVGLPHRTMDNCQKASVMSLDTLAWNIPSSFAACTLNTRSWTFCEVSGAYTPPQIELPCSHP
jgi:hypothetical protein